MCGSAKPQRRKFKVCDKVHVSKNGAKVRPRLAGRTGVVTATKKEDMKLFSFEVRVKLNGNKRGSVYDEGFFTKARK